MVRLFGLASKSASASMSTTVRSPDAFSWYCQVKAFRADPTPRCWQRRALKPHHLAARFELETST